MIEKLKRLPEAPGVYLLKNKSGDIIYIGKAKVLKNRVKSYFQKGKKDLKTEVLSEQIFDFDYIITKNEFEAFLLENTLIKQHKPKYNILLKDDKSFPYLKLTIKDKYPGLYLVRETKSKSAVYFGPYFAGDAKKFLEIIYKIFKIRQCKIDLKKPLSRPCIYYNTGICFAPCVRFISDSAYKVSVENVIKFLRGSYKETIEILKNKMNKYSEKQEYEKAAQMRDYIKVIENIMNEQKVVLNKEKDMDVINYLFSDNHYYFGVLKVRSGRLINKEIMVFKDLPENESPVEIFLMQYYARNIDVPLEILLPDKSASPFIAKFFRKENIKVVYKKRDALLDIAMQNILDREKQEKEIENKELKFTNQVVELQKSLNLTKIPEIIDGIDISHFSGLNTVGSCVVLKNGIPDKSLYRRYKIKEVRLSDDYSAIKEVIQRRYSKIKNENSKLPDLILIDGGLGQVNIAKEELRKLNLDIPVVGLAKKEESVYIPYNNKPVFITDDALLLLKRIRDEAHRFALSYQTKITMKKFKKSILDDLSFIGEKTKYRIYNEFKNLDELLDAIKDNKKEISFLTKKQKDILLEILKKRESNEDKHKK